MFLLPEAPYSRIMIMIHDGMINEFMMSRQYHIRICFMKLLLSLLLVDHLKSTLPYPAVANHWTS
jgi:hypothetical protein